MIGSAYFSLVPRAERRGVRGVPQKNEERERVLVKKQKACQPAFAVAVAVGETETQHTCGVLSGAKISEISSEISDIGKWRSSAKAESSREAEAAPNFEAVGSCRCIKPTIRKRTLRCHLRLTPGV